MQDLSFHKIIWYFTQEVAPLSPFLFTFFFFCLFEILDSFYDHTYTTNAVLQVNISPKFHQVFSGSFLSETLLLITPIYDGRKSLIHYCIIFKCFCACIWPCKQMVYYLSHLERVIFKRTYQNFSFSFCSANIRCLVWSLAFVTIQISKNNASHRCSCIFDCPEKWLLCWDTIIAVFS